MFNNQPKIDVKPTKMDLSYLAVPGVLAQLEKAGQPKPNLPGASAKVLHSRGLH